MLGASPAAAAARFGKPAEVGATRHDVGHLVLAVSAGGHAAMAAGTDAGDRNGHVVVATRAPGGRFGRLRDIALSGWPLPIGQIPSQPPPLALDARGRPLTVEQFEDGCCLRLRAVFADAAGRRRGSQVVTPAKPNWSGVLTSDQHGHAALESLAEGPLIRVATSTGGPFGKAAAVPRSELDAGAITPAPDGTLTATYYLGEEAQIARRGRSGRWSGPRRLFRSDRGETISQVRVHHAAAGRGAIAIHAGLAQPHRVVVAWGRGGSFAGPREDVAIGSPDFIDSAVDASGRLTVAWVEGERTVRAVSAGFGGRFGEVRTLWSAPEDRTVEYLDLAAGGGRTVASWTDYPTTARAAPIAVRALEVRKGRAVGEPQVVANPAANAYSSRLALDWRGGGVLAWIEQDERVTPLTKRLRAALLPL